ncbi:MAG: tRNA (adenosine(37)-N6)-threonylcarbamoyltransferase complex ATPase subunit type 1 TsaE [Gemmatimonadales bacterium]
MTPPVLDLTALQAAGAALGASLPSGSVVWLEGELGSGKTTLVRAILGGRDVTTPGASPTYALVHHHEGPRGAAYHLDCYRLRHPDEAADLDWETLATADLLLIEWPERAGAWAPPATHRIRLGHVDEDTRSMEVA